MKPQPLDLEEFRKWRAKTNPDLTFSISQIEFIKQRLKSACEFYLRYKDNPEVLGREHLEYYDMVVSEAERIGVLEFEKIENLRFYNEWLFKLAFKGVME